jgi:hypothetical protein
MTLPDVNVWLALAWEGHRHHEKARAWFDAQPDGMLAFCRVTQMGLLRLLTQPAVMGEDVLTQRGAWQVHDALMGDARCVFQAEPQGLEPAWKRLSSREDAAHRRWTDDYLAAFAAEAGLELVTFDRGIAALPGVSVKVL